MYRRMKLTAFKRIITAEIQINNKSINIENFKMDFSINKTESKDPNTCKLNVYNLSEQTRNQITNEDSIIIIRAGYEEQAGAEVIFIGDIIDVSHIIAKPNIITNIESKDGQKALTNKKIAVSFKEGVGRTTLINRAITALGLPNKTKDSLISIKNKIYNGGYQYTGTVKKLLDDLTGEDNEIWSIQNNELKIYDADDNDKSFSLTINQNTGMIGSPKQIKIKRGKKQNDVAGWEVESLLLPKAEPGGTIKLRSIAIPEETTFKIINVEHNSDNIKDKSITNLQVI